MEDEKAENQEVPEVEVPEVEVIVAIEKDIPANAEKKQVTWNKLGDNVIADFPCGKQLYFDMTTFDTTIMKYYGMKQWISDQVSAVKGEKDKILGMMEAYNDAAKMGIELTPTGKIRSLGKPRSNATGAAEAKRFETEMKNEAKTVSLSGLIMKQQIAATQERLGQTISDPFTDEDQAKLGELLIAAAKAVAK